MKTITVSKSVVKNHKSILVVKSNVKSGPPLIIRRGDL